MSAPRSGGAGRPDGARREASILHVDMDAFFVSVELLRHPELRGRPVVVGGDGARGVIAAASYEARAYGVHSAMASLRARRLCPDAVFLRGDHAHYSEVSRRVMALFASVTPLVEPLSLDEAFLDVGGARRLLGTPAQIAVVIRERVADEEGLACSVGLSVVKFLAKLASQDAKPRASRRGTQAGRGVLEITPGTELAYLHPLPVERLWGVGPVTLARLQRLGVTTVGDLAALPVDAVVTALGKASGTHLHDLAHAVDPRRVEPDQGTKSIGHEETFRHDHHRHDTLGVELLRMAEAVGTRLRSAGLTGRTITIKVRFGDFRTITRSTTVSGGLDSSRELARVARMLLEGVDPAAGVRLLGVSVSQLDGDRPRQLSLDDLIEDPSGQEGATSPADWERAESAMDAIRARFGAASVGPAALADSDGLRIAQRGAQQWGPDAAPDDHSP